MDNQDEVVGLIGQAIDSTQYLDLIQLNREVDRQIKRQKSYNMKATLPNRGSTSD